MNRIFALIAMTGVILVGARALAVDSVNQSTMSKRELVAQMAGCMRKQMSTNHRISYNEAAVEDALNEMPRITILNCHLMQVPWCDGVLDKGTVRSTTAVLRIDDRLGLFNARIPAEHFLVAPPPSRVASLS
jgi:hypothetical protein